APLHTYDLPPFPTRRSSDLHLLQHLRGDDLPRRRGPARRLRGRLRQDRDVPAALREGRAGVRVRRSVRSVVPMKELLFVSCTERSEEHTSELQSLTNLVCRL